MACTRVYKEESNLEEVVGVIEDEELRKRDVSIDNYDGGGPCKMGNMPGR